MSPMFGHGQIGVRGSVTFGHEGRFAGIVLGLSKATDANWISIIQLLIMEEEWPFLSRKVADASKILWRRLPSLIVPSGQFRKHPWGGKQTDDDVQRNHQYHHHKHACWWIRDPEKGRKSG